MDSHIEIYEMQKNTFIKKNEMNYLRKITCWITTLITFIVITWGCQQETSEPEYTSRSIEDFLTINEELFKDLCNNPIFESVTREYLSTRDSMVKNEGKKYQAWQNAIARVDSLGKASECWNLLAYCLRYEKERMFLSRVTHAWGPCQMYSGDPCNTILNWQDGWTTYERIEYTALLNISSINRHHFRNDMTSFLYGTGHPGTAFYFKRYVEDLSSDVLFTCSKGDIMNIPLVNLVNNYGPNNICQEIYYMGQHFYDYVAVSTWIDDKSRPTSGSGSGSSSGSKNEAINKLTEAMSEWNGPSHTFILEKATLNLNLPSEMIVAYIKASRWCDSFFEGNQDSENAVLHAMKSSQEETYEKAKEKFEKHLTIYLNSSFENNNFWDMGVVLHGITDSFCPSHEGFQYFDWSNPNGIAKHMEWDNWKNSPERTLQTIEFVQNVLKIAYGNDDYADKGGRTKVIIEYWQEEYEKL